MRGELTKMTALYDSTVKTLQYAADERTGMLKIRFGVERNKIIQLGTSQGL